jgi:hypothetical protein
VQWAGELAGIAGPPEILYPEKEKLSILRYLMEAAAQLWAESRAGTGLVPQARM